QELTESPVLREWWQQVQAKKQGPDLQEILNEVHTLGGYLGDEIVFAVPMSWGHHGTPLVLAQVSKPGLKEFLAQGYAKQSKIQVLDEQALNRLPASENAHGLLILVTDNLVVAGENAGALQRLDITIKQGSGGFSGTAFGQRMADAYQHGAGVLLGANLE